MHQDNLLETKLNVRNGLLGQLESDLLFLKDTMREIQASANEETKSSVGDKYETGRAMAQLEIEKISQQIRDKDHAIHLLNKVPTVILNQVIELGCLIRTTGGNFYLSVSGLPLNHTGERIYPISLSSPLGKTLLGKRQGDRVEVNGRPLTILDFF
jgi:hypothetical protein